MSTIINLDSKQKEDISRVLSKYLSRSAQGKKIIAEIEDDQVQGGEALIAYLDERLPHDEALRSEIVEALEKSEREQFITVITQGGSVGEVINIGQLDELDIRYYLFSDVRQVLTMMLGIVLIGGVVLFTIWWSQQPRRMRGDFNIAVAELVPTGEAVDIAPIVSQRLFSFLDGQYKLSSFADVQVAHKNIGAITSAEEARALAERINAHLVIYGDVVAIGDQVLVSPQFYVVETHQTDVGEVNGEHKLAARISLRLQDLVSPTSESLALMQQNTAILVEFTKALVYLAAGSETDLMLAQKSIDEAIDKSKNYDEFEGQEVIFLFASDIARRQGKMDEAQTHLNTALNLNTNYGRGYLAQANIFYDQGDFYAAKMFYERAINHGDNPLGAYVFEKASLGLGNICFVQYQYVQRNDQADKAEADRLARCGLDHYQQVITAYNQQPEPEPILREMAAGAYFSSGTIYQINGQFDAARLAYEQALKLTKDAGRKQQIQAVLKEVNEK